MKRNLLLAPLALCMLPLLNGYGGSRIQDAASFLIGTSAKADAVDGTEVPAAEAIATMHTKTMEVFLKSLAAKDMTEYHASLAKVAQEQLTVEKLNAEYKAIMDGADELSTLMKAEEPVFEPEAKIEKSQLVITGYYDSEPRLRFSTKYYAEEGVWMPTNVTLKLDAAATQ
jgi:hypothetical protein